MERQVFKGGMRMAAVVRLLASSLIGRKSNKSALGLAGIGRCLQGWSYLMVPHHLYTNASSVRQFFLVILGFFLFACVVNWLVCYEGCMVL